MRKYFVLLVLLVLPVLAQETVSLPTLVSGSELCVAVEPLAAWLGATCQPGANDQLKITLGKQTAQLQVASLIVANTQGVRGLLPTLPVRVNGIVYVPARALVQHLGGTTTPQVDGGLLLAFNGKSVLLPPVLPPAPAESPLERTAFFTRDPRVPLEQLLGNYDRIAGIRPYLDGFNTLAKPLQPALKAVTNSKTLRLIGHVPIAGALIRVSQDAAGTVNEAIGLAGRVAQFDRECLAPLREALTAAAGISAQTDATGIQAARVKWTAALPAVDKLHATEAGLAQSLRRLNTVLGKVETTLTQFTKSYPKSSYVLSVKPLQRQTGELQLRLGAHQWQLAAMKDYFTRLLAESAGVQ